MLGQPEPRGDVAHRGTRPVRVVPLDVLRAAAIALVFGSHLPTPTTPLPAGLDRFFLFWKRFGWTGVDLFFVLSGFLVSGLLFREYATTGAIRPGRFLIRRGLKIYPAFYVLFVVTLVVRHELAIPTGVWATIGEAAFLQNYHYGLWGHTWSLAVEEHFYILLVVALTSIVAVSRSPFRVLERIFIAVPIVVLGLRIATHVLLPFQHHTHHWPTHLRIDSLLFGVSLAYLEHLKPARFAALLRWRIPLLCVGALGLIPPLFLPADHPFVHTIGYTLLYVGYGSILIFALGQPPARFGWSRAGLRWTAALGAYSYSIYLWHVPFTAWIMPAVIRTVRGPFLVTVAFQCVGAGLAGVLLARLIEFPVLRLRDRFFPSRVDAAVTPATSVPDAPPALT